MHSLTLNHAFVDGNKRTATASTIRFLYLNGYELKVGQTELLQFALDVASKKVDMNGISSWLKKNSMKI